MSPNTAIHLHSAFRELEAFAIAGIGTFRKQYHEAAIGEHGDVTPPSSRLHFDKQVDNTLLLKDFLYTHLGISEIEADKTEQELRIEMTWALETRRKFEIAEIGTLIRTTDGITMFEPIEAGSDVVGGTFGLQPVMAPVATSPAVTAAAAPAAATPITAVMPAAIFPWKPIGLLLLFGLIFSFVLYTAVYRSGKTARQAKNEGLIAASEMAATQDTGVAKQPAIQSLNSQPSELLAQNNAANDAGEMTRGLDETGGAMRMSGTRGIESVKRTYGVVVGDLSMLSELSTTEQAIIRSRTAEAAATSVRNKSNPNAISEANEAQQGGDNMVAARSPQKGTFHIVGGSFSTLDKANEYVAEAQAEGLSPVILFPATGSSASYRVSIFSSNERAIATAFAARQKAQGKKTGWLLAL